MKSNYFSIINNSVGNEILLGVSGKGKTWK